MTTSTESFITSRGWTYQQEADEECGAPSVSGPSGWCSRRAHWYKRNLLCAVHARISEQVADALKAEGDRCPDCHFIQGHSEFCPGFARNDSDRVEPTKP